MEETPKACLEVALWSLGRALCCAPLAMTTGTGVTLHARHGKMEAPPSIPEQAPLGGNGRQRGRCGQEVPRDAVSELTEPGPCTGPWQVQRRISIRNSDRQRRETRKGARLVVYTVTPQNPRGSRSGVRGDWGVAGGRG